MTLLRTTGGSEVNLRCVNEALEGKDGLVTLFLSDGEIRHASKPHWDDARERADSHLLMAAPGTFVLRITTAEIPEVFREPVIAWLINRDRYPYPITIVGVHGDDIYAPTIMTPDGAVQSAYSQFPDYDSWHRSLISQLDEPEAGVGLDRAYYSGTGRYYLARDLDPFY